MPSKAEDLLIREALDNARQVLEAYEAIVEFAQGDGTYHDDTIGFAALNITNYSSLYGILNHRLKDSLDDAEAALLRKDA